MHPCTLRRHNIATCHTRCFPVIMLVVFLDMEKLGGSVSCTFSSKHIYFIQFINCKANSLIYWICIEQLLLDSNILCWGYKAERGHEVGWDGNYFQSSRPFSERNVKQMKHVGDSPNQAWATAYVQN